jgi:hypothetical protein
MAATHIAYVDETDGNDRESYSFFYGEMFVGSTKAEAKAKADAYLNGRGGIGTVHFREAKG